jgi:hypothetical protein
MTAARRFLGKGSGWTGRRSSFWRRLREGEVRPWRDGWRWCGGCWSDQRASERKKGMAVALMLLWLRVGIADTRSSASPTLYKNR